MTSRRQVELRMWPEGGTTLKWESIIDLLRDSTSVSWAILELDAYKDEHQEPEFALTKEQIEAGQVRWMNLSDIKILGSEIVSINWTWIVGVQGSTLDVSAFEGSLSINNSYVQLRVIDSATLLIDYIIGTPCVYEDKVARLSQKNGVNSDFKFDI